MHDFRIDLLVFGIPKNISFNMAKQQKEIKEKAIEISLWDAANKLRGSVEPAEYKHVVLSLIFLKFASDKFELHREKLIAEGKEKYLEMEAFYAKDNFFSWRKAAAGVFSSKNRSKTILPCSSTQPCTILKKRTKRCAVPCPITISPDWD
jgi:hypothetical protein